MVLHTTYSRNFAGTCRRGCKTDSRGPLRQDIPNAFPGMTGESGKSAGNLFPGTEEGMKNPPPLGISTCVIHNSVIPHNEGIWRRFFMEVWMLVNHLSCIGRSCWALHESQFPQLRSASHLAATPHTGGDQIVQMRRVLKGLSTVMLERYFISCSLRVWQTRPGFQTVCRMLKYSLFVRSFKKRKVPSSSTTPATRWCFLAGLFGTLNLWQRRYYLRYLDWASNCSTSRHGKL